MILLPIHTQRLIIRQLQQEDWQAVYTYTSDPQVMAYIPEGVFNEEQAQEFVASNSGDEARAFALLLPEGQQLIGHLLFHPWFAPRTYEVGWVLHSAHHGKGYASEAAGALLKYGFEVLDLHRIIATCQPENIGSYRVMEKIGMRREGLFVQCIPRPDGSWWSEYFYAMLAEEWFAHRSP